MTSTLSENADIPEVIGKRMDEVVTPKVGLQTGDNNYFLREWWENLKYVVAYWCI